MPPIKPSELGAKQTQALPDEVFDAFNELIAKEWNGSSATILQSAAVAKIAAKLDILKVEVFERRYLSIEEAYRLAGWIVEYDKPAYNESYEANFIFHKKG